MIPVFLRRMAPRLVLVALAGWVFFLLEPGFHAHEHGAEGFDVELGPLGISATLANYAALCMVILLGGFIAGDRRRGYHRLFFSHPTRPVAFYGLQWLLGLALSVGAAAVFLVVGQLAAWGEFRGGWAGLLLAAVFALVYGGLLAFFSAVLPRGDAWATVAVYALNLVWGGLAAVGAQPFAPAVRALVSFVLPPQAAMEGLYATLVRGEVDWAAAGFAAGYGAFWLLLAALVVSSREWE